MENSGNVVYYEGCPTSHSNIFVYMCVTLYNVHKHNCITKHCVNAMLFWFQSKVLENEGNYRLQVGHATSVQPHCAYGFMTQPFGI